jgi:tetratricopeptide (TPR) repeat protein
MTDPLRSLWDFDDLDATERRFEALRADALTQLARVHGLRGDFAEGDRLLDEAEAGGASRTRVLLERGRLRRSGGDPEAALPLFDSAFALALEAEEHFLAADAAHMAALAAPDLDATVAWTERGIELAEARAPYWLGPLVNNLGWEYYDAGRYELALATFRRSLEIREREPERQREIALARYSLAKALQALGRDAEAREHAQPALPVLRETDPSLADELAS